MEKRQIRMLNIFPTAEGSYFLVLEDIASLDKFGIITFQTEASYILSFYFEKKSPRPTLYEVFSNYLMQTNAHLQEVVLTEYRNNIYHAKLVCRQESGDKLSFDMRATDAIALACLNKKPIYAMEKVVQECSVKYGAIIDRLIEKSQGIQSLAQAKREQTSSATTTNTHTKSQPALSYEEQLEQAIRNEDYELAARLKKANDLTSATQRNDPHK